MTTAVVPAEAARPTSASDGGGGGASSQERSRVCAELAREVGGFRDVSAPSVRSRLKRLRAITSMKQANAEHAVVTISPVEDRIARVFPDTGVFRPIPAAPAPFVAEAARSAILHDGERYVRGLDAALHLRAKLEGVRR